MVTTTIDPVNLVSVWEAYAKKLEILLKEKEVEIVQLNENIRLLNEEIENGVVVYVRRGLKQ